MGMPTFPDLSDPAPFEDILDRLLETIAVEELALAHLVNAEAEKVQTVAQDGFLGPVFANGVTALNTSVADLLAQVLAKEMQLQQKLSRLLFVRNQIEG